MEPIKTTYYVSEIFRSLQGEGPLCGRRCLFIRFHFCNLTCSWCDSKYTWHQRSAPYTPYSAAALKTLITRHGIKHVILTGGEPCLYRLDLLDVVGFEFQVETNGIFFPTEPIENLRLPDKTLFTRRGMSESVLKRYEWVVSPKLLHAKQRYGTDGIESFARLEKAFFKFVIRDVDSDLDEVDTLVKRHGIDPQKVYISFEGITPQSQLKPQWVEKVLEKYHYSPRLHVLLWPGERK